MWRMARRNPVGLDASDSDPHQSRLLVGLVLVATVIAVVSVLAVVAVSFVGSWLTDQETSGWPILEAFTTTPQTSSPPPLEVACLAEGIRFPASFLDGPQFTRDQFLATPTGHSFGAFFTRGPGQAANGPYLSAEGFSVVSESLVLGYSHGLPLLLLRPTDVAIASFPDCLLTMVVGDAVAARWVPEEPVDADATSLRVAVIAEGCTTATGTESLTELWGTSVVWDSQSVQVTVWTRPRTFSVDHCARTAVVLSEEIGLDAPLGGRALFDGGFVPPFVIDR